MGASERGSEGSGARSSSHAHVNVDENVNNALVDCSSGLTTAAQLQSIRGDRIVQYHAVLYVARHACDACMWFLLPQMHWHRGDAARHRGLVL